MTATTPTIDEQRVEAFVERVVLDVGTAMRGGLLYIGDRLGIFKTLSESGPVTPEELAKETGLNERYLREWLGSMTTPQDPEHDAQSGTDHLPPQHPLP